ncbi:MAG: four helix bundle protein [Microcoleus sp. PH2017_10_PVI_O_A]|uniref:four helix bundle protein n=1 Tax=unclassified Microcoleus TaxID=2642155 RepID=UPI001D48AC30|nr:MULTISPECIES: four helix bundle protein [unclassified Microcoleus]TAE82937.1 MAG: four helix bundle protein [Oscillatoriales cyanobacterium]MCC3406136.1 four helix bundle protein [Microcoleus sp. PH2017_10_PVI_O_A]MCC3460544.1 four helix bundle protein [Microcoleus sp. PH2017_11_PCY_U_A]MCC3479037.1 four helix bundle protein [Microcoleus sp. PH2017_12_PCY_D_A]MCC3529432.1 four helix bundle protein [Microcoleus sp. PH2017_21_RUC_O_A]
MTSKSFQDLRVYRLSERLADEIWTTVNTWDSFAKNTIGQQIVRSADSVGANIAEGVGRGSYQDNRRFVKIARGSLYETQHWLRRAYTRNLLTVEQVNTFTTIINDLAPQLNSYLQSIGSSPKNYDE